MSDFLAETIAALLFVAAAALLLMLGLHGLHVTAGYWPCFAVCLAAHLMLRNGTSGGAR